jgi:signal transduction histidine kinase
MPSEVSTVTGEQGVEALRRELAEARERQAATVEILASISSSVTDANQVFAKIAASAARLCDANDATIFQVDGDLLRRVANNASIPQYEMRGDDTMPLTREVVGGRAVLDGKTIQVADLQAEMGEYPEGSHRARRVGHRTILAVPLMRVGEAIGVIAIRRTEVRQFTDRQIDLLKTFADQAVIAIENTRLFEEVQQKNRALIESNTQLTETLEQQTASSEILRVISTSSTNLQPVLDTVVKSAARFCGAPDASIFRLDGGNLRADAHHGPVSQPTGFLVPVVRGTVAGRAVLERRAIHVTDLQAEIEEFPEGSALSRQIGQRAMLVAPLLLEGAPTGVIVLRRAEAVPFTDKQIALLKTFADQAVIAIENTRLFEEVQARTRELAKTVEDLEIASQHKSQFVANMSHELRTPLAAMLGYAELLHEGIYGMLPEKSLPILTRIRSNGKHLLDLINTVLDIAKIESGQFNLNLGEYALDSVVETLRAATEALAETKKLLLKTEVAKSLPIGLGDEQRLTQVLLNLVGNAIKFTDTGEVRIAATTANGHFAVSVADTGPGIPQEHQARIFEQFHQVDSSNTKAKGGTGLGLAIAREIVEMHGGRIWVESTLGQGSTFRMELPVRAPIAVGAT